MTDNRRPPPPPPGPGPRNVKGNHDKPSAPPRPPVNPGYRK